jgi:predicted AAA+ superfamily ATPase
LFDDDVKKFELQYINGYDISVLDEVQSCKDAGRKLKYLVDSGRKLWITSSSEVILGKEILSYLVGRISIIKLYPFSYEEFLNAKGQKQMTSIVAQRMMWEHMQYGGYPKVVLTDDVEMKKTILRDLHETMLLKDAARTFSIDDIRSLEEFAKYLALCSGTLISYGELSNSLKMSFQTIKKYLDAMEKSYFIARVYPYYTNKLKEIVKQPKLYFIDTGLRNVIAKSFNAKPDGRLFENYVYTEMLKLGVMPKYWRTKTKTEVDFVVERDNAVIPVEVKLSANPGKIERGLRSFIGMYQPKTALVVTYNGKHGSMNVNGCKVYFTDVADLKQYVI